MERSKHFKHYVGLSALFIAGSAAFFSVFGLSKLFAGAALSVIIMASSLEFGKIIGASFLYRYWNKIHNWLKIYMTIGVITLVLITSAGIFGYLSNAYQGATIQFEKQSTTLLYKEDRLVQLEEDKVYLKEELKQSLSSLPDNYITAKRKLREDYNPKVLELNDAILKIKQEVGDLKVGLIETGVDVGPAIYLARAFKTDIDTVVKFFIFILIFVFDPMAVSLIIAYNRVIEDETTEDKPPMNWIEGMSKELKKKKSKVKKQVKKFEEHIIPDTVVIDELQEEENTKVLDKNIGKGGRAGK
jgi:hypothetical protein|tara:strand:- start:427 stop:1329 length:903 start_codon:yes stop_codon:yes gene_type:complete